MQGRRPLGIRSRGDLRPPVTTTTTRSHDLADPTNLLDLASWQEEVDVEGRLRTQSYDGAERTLTERSPEGRETRTKLDAKGRVVEVARLDAEGDGPAPQTYTWDGRGRLTGEWDPERGSFRVVRVEGA